MFKKISLNLISEKGKGVFYLLIFILEIKVEGMVILKLVDLERRLKDA